MYSISMLKISIIYYKHAKIRISVVIMTCCTVDFPEVYTSICTL